MKGNEMENKFCTLEIKGCSWKRLTVYLIIDVAIFILVMPILVEITKWWFNIVQGWF